MEKRMKQLSAELKSQVASGSVIISCASAVKELVENSLDAGASTIDVRLADFGANTIEVADNGHGVEETDFESLVLKGHTSKLQKFEDLNTVGTFGFRGDALSALCVLSELTIQTRVAGANIGYELVFDQAGKLVKKTTMQKQPGTTVIVKELFRSLPVRREQFLGNARKEMPKLLRILNSYGIIVSGVRVTCSNTCNGKSVSLLRTSGHVDMLANINEIFGIKQKLVALKTCQPTPEILEEYNLMDENNSAHVFTVDGWISDSQNGGSRGANDRQFFFVNQRPCELPKVAKLVNQIYREFCSDGNPFIAFDIRLDQASIDVNVVPHKNQILIPNEKLLLAIIKASVQKTFREKSSSVPLNKSVDLPDKTVNRSFVLPRPNAKLVTGTPNGNWLDRFKYPGTSSAEPCRTKPSVTNGLGKKLPNSSPKKRIGSDNDPVDRRDNKFFKLSSADGSMDTMDLEPEDDMDTNQNLFRHPFDISSRLSNARGFEGFGSQIEESESVIGDLTSTPRPFSQFSTQSSELPGRLCIPQIFDSQPPTSGGFFASRLPATQNNVFNTESMEDEFRLDFGLSGDDSHASGSGHGSVTRSMDDTEGQCTRVGTGPFVTMYPLPRSFVGTAAPDSGRRLEKPPTGPGFGTPLSSDDGQLAGVGRPEIELDGDDEVQVLPDPVQSRRNAVTATNYGDSVIHSAAPPMQLPFTGAMRLPPTAPSTASRQPRSGRPKASPKQSVTVVTPKKCHPSAIGNNSSFISVTPSVVVKPKILNQLESRPAMNVMLTLEKIREACRKAKDSSAGVPASDQQVFHAEITPSLNEVAELELERNLKKTDFLAMQIVGQFNNGFIVTQLTGDCFLIDQHASDERFNYESLQTSFTLEKQPLIRPMPLELTAGEETTLLEHEEIFLKNGFTFSVQPEKNFSRVNLTAAPIVHNQMLGKDDIMEMLHVLEETEGVNVRPKRILQMIASKACRKSVMIGDPLNNTQMTTVRSIAAHCTDDGLRFAKVVQHMAGLLEPWRCAHGRPTIRHLFNLNSFES